MNPIIPTSPETTVDIDFNGGDHGRISFSDEPGNEADVPLLLQPSYARSKSAISDELRHFRICLKWCALDHSSTSGKCISYFVFGFLTVFVPVLAAAAVRDSPGDNPNSAVSSFNKLVQLPESALAAIGFFTLSRFFRKYGLRQLLFLDGLTDDSPHVRRRYARELEKAFRCLGCILFPSFFVELAHKIIFFSSVKLSLPFFTSSSTPNDVVPVNSVVFALVLASWVYRSGVFLLVCVLFRLTCELQILRFEGFQKLFEVATGYDQESSNSSCGVIFKEHVRIRKQLWVTSHRFRFFIIAGLVTITVSQFGALLLVLGSKTQKTFLNSGDLVVCSAVELSGFFVCLVGAARITHRAQRIVSIATRWHVLVTCASSGPDQCKAQIHEAPNLDHRCGESDSDSSDNFISSAPPQDPSSFRTRQALVAYLQHNSGGITLFGFALDRGMLHTLFAFEFSLVLWILSKVVVLS